jgi:hypothetical protein
MNFDDLHDPEPPRPGVDTLATVAGRARQIRRRRAALVGAGGALAVALVAVPLALVLTGDDESGRLVPATVPDAPAPPPTTAAATTTTSVPPVLSPDVVAIRADGDAVRIAPDGSQTVLYDGADPRVQPEEGELTIVDSVVVTADGRTFVSTCCEPVPGSWFEVSAGAEPEFRAYGHGLDVTSDGQKILTVGGEAVTVSDPDAGAVTQTMFDDWDQPYEAMWLAGGGVAVLELRQVDDRLEFVLSVADTPSAAATAESGVAIGSNIEAPWPALAGVADDGSVLVFQGAGDPATATALHAYDPDTLERRADVPLPAEATFARMEDGVLTWIGVDGSLHVGDAVVPGEYRWARPVS